MANQINVFSDLGALALTVQEDANFILRESVFVDRLIRNFTDRLPGGGNTRTRHEYNEATMNEVSDADDLSSQAFTPSAQEVLTPKEIGAQFFFTDTRVDSDAPEDQLGDAAMELGLAGADKISQDIYGLFSSLTGGTVGLAGTTMSWGLLSAAISQARVASKSNVIPLAVVMHTYQYHQLGKSASVAGQSLAQAPTFTDEITRRWFVGTYADASIFVTPDLPVDASDDAYCGVFPRDAMAIDWRKMPFVEPDRDASRRGTELNYSGRYAVGVWRPLTGVQLITDASAPSS